jgi:hypothetical protein
MKYNNKSGIAIKAQFPEETMKLEENALMHIFNIHEFSKESGIASMTVDNLNITTYYSGVDTDFFIVIKLDSLEDPDEFEESLNNISQIILDNLEEDKYVEMLPTLFKKISGVSENV